MDARRTVILVNDYSAGGGPADYISVLRESIPQFGWQALSYSRHLGLRLDNLGNATFDLEARHRGPIASLNAALFDADLAYEFTRVLEEQRPDLVHLNGIGRSPLSYLIPLWEQGLPCIATLHDIGRLCPTWTYKWPDGTRCDTTFSLACMTHGCIDVSRFLRFAAQNSLYRTGTLAAVDLFIVPCAALGEVASRAGIQPVEIVPNCSMDVPQGYGDVQKTRELVWAGRLTKSKGPERAIQLLATKAATRREWRLGILGDGAEKRALTEDAERMGVADRVEFLGWKTGEDYLREIARSRVLLFTSQQWDTFPTVVLQGMSCGLPIVATDVGGVREMVDDGINGLVVASEADDRLGDAVASILENKSKVSAMGAASRQIWEERYAPNVHAERLTRAYARLVDRRLGISSRGSP